MQLNEQRVAAFYSFMTERENIRLRRLLGWPREEWTNDPIFKKFSFTNVKREHDRTTVQLHKEFYEDWTGSALSNDVSYVPTWDDYRVLLLNCALFRYFGCIESAQQIGWSDDWSDACIKQIMDYGMLDELKFTSAYIIPACGRSEPKYSIVIDIIDGIWRRAGDVVGNDPWIPQSWERQCAVLSSCYGCGSFMAKEIILDYILATKILPNDWQTWTPVGPGGRRGADRVLNGTRMGINEKEALEVIRAVYAMRTEYWREDFVKLDLTDIQWCFCEYDKYSRIPEGKTPKRRFKPTIDEITRSVIRE